MPDYRRQRGAKGTAARRVKRFVISGMSVVVVTSSMNISMISSVYAAGPQAVSENLSAGKHTANTSAAPVISEIVADTAAPAGLPGVGENAFEYVEIYNPTAQTLSLNDYQIRDITSETATDWKIPEGTSVEAGKTLILWIGNGESQNLETEDFCTYYGLDQNEVQIVKTEDVMAGLDGEDARALQITDKEGEEIFAQALYNDGEEKTRTDKGVSFLFEEGMVRETVLSYEEEPTPGKLGEEQENALQNTETLSGQTEDQSAKDAAAKNDPAAADITVTQDAQTADQNHAEQQDADESLKPDTQENTMTTPLIISEIVADTHQADQTTASGTDAFEYVEIYNASDRTVSMDEYLIQNVNGSTLTDWEIPAGTQIEAGKTLTVWITNDESKDLTTEDFCSYYGVSENEIQLVKTTERVNGFSNSGERSIRLIVRNTEQTITRITYNDGEEKAQTKKGINFAYVQGQVQQQTLSYDQDPTPGTVADGQIPAEQYLVAEQADASVTVTAPEEINKGDDLEISAVTSLKKVVMSASVQYGEKQYPMTYADGTYQAQIPAEDLEGTDSAAFTVQMSDGVNSVSAEKTVAVNQDAVTEKYLTSPILITEIVPNTENVGGSDAFEYFEIYNTTDRTVDLSQYSFQYVNGSTVTEWELADPAIQLGARETLTVWVKNDANKEAGYTAENFNEAYGTELEEGKNLTTVSSDGFSNSGSRGMMIQSRTGLIMSQVTYTAADSSNGKLDEEEAIRFSYDGETAITQYDQSVTPGTLGENQTVEGTFVFPAAAENPAVEADAPAIVKEGEDWAVTLADTNLDADRILSAQLDIYKKDSADQVMSVPMTYQDGTLKATVPYHDLKDLESFSYNIVVSDGVNTASSRMGTAAVEGMTPVDNTKAPALVVSEIMPDSSNANGGDAYEFIEIYNNSNRDIDLKDYKLYYNYPDNGDDSDVVWWETSESRILKSGDTLVFWIRNGSNDDLTIEDFNAKFGTALNAGHLVEISCGGMANSGARGVKIATNVKDNIDYVTYNMNGADNTSADKSITFQSQYQEDVFTSVLTADDADPTPGTVSDSAKPVYQAELPETAAEPVLTDRTPETFNGEEDLSFALDAVSQDTTIKTVHLYVKDNYSDGYEMYNLLRENGDSFSKSLSAVDLYGKEYYEYYFEVSDGYQTVTTEPKQIKNENPLPEGDQLNVSDDEFLSGTRAIIGTGGDLKIDGEDVGVQAVPSINGDARIAFDTSQTDVFFKNAVAIGDSLLGVFREGTYDTWATYSYDVDESYFDSETKEITIAFHAGNKANALEHDVENNDDFVLKNIRLILPDGVSLRPVSYGGVNGIGAIEHTADNWHPDQPRDLGDITPETEISMGDGTTKVEILYVTFQLDEKNFNAVRYDLDTTELADGEHTITSGEKTATVIVDNTAPEITTNIEEGALYRNHELEVSASDELSETTELTAVLDGEVIGLPYTISAETLEAGTHSLVLTATDEAGNVSEKTVTFEIPEENASAESTSPDDGSTVHGDPSLSVNVTDPTEDQMTVTFKKGERYELGDSEITQSSGISNAAGTAGGSFAENTGNGLPYQVFEIQAGEDALAADEIRVQWQGTSNNAKTFLYVYNTTSGGWDPVDTQQTTDGETMTLTGDVALADHLEGTMVKVMVQNGEGYTPDQYAPGEGLDHESVKPNENDTPRENYDFTFVVESDTQYYNEDYEGNPSQDVDGVYQYQLDIHKWVLENRERMNIQYMFHDGDIIDDEPLIPEWENADAAYRMLDVARLPYGVLAGNHDVGHLSGDYTNFSKYFGESRYNQNPWYGGSYKDNRGHYDLITVDGIDFIMVYMGWGVGDEEIAWMNQVLAQYPERKAILNFHEYLLASGGMGEEPQRIYDEVVSANPNVCMVLSGHYHNAQTRIDSFDDDGDGVEERKVYQMLFDYQGLAQGGMGYIRLMHFDLEGQQIIVRTYSPSLDDYNAKDETDIGNVAGINGDEEFTIPFADLGITPETKTLETTGLSVDVYGNEVIGTVENVQSGTSAEYTWKNAPEGTTGWYAEITDENGGLSRTDVNYLTVEKAGYEPVITLPDPSADTVEQGGSFDPMDGVSAKDYAGSDLTAQITVTGTVDTSVPGTYELIYTITDANGNTATVTRTIQVTVREEEGQKPGGDEAQTPGGGNQDQKPDGSQGTVPGDPDAGQGQGFQNLSSDKGGNLLSGAHGQTPQTGDTLFADFGLSLAGLLASIAVIAGLIKKKVSGLLKNRK